MAYNKSSTLHTFTIVELLIVIIGILAAITIVSYTGITSRANIASLNSDLSNASQQLKLFQTDNLASDYPTTINCTGDTATNKCIKANSNTTYDYKSDTSPKSFCLTATKNNQSYNVNQDGVILAGPCPVLNLDASNSLSYPGTGTTWYDLSGNGNDGVLNNGLLHSNVNGGVMSFDGLDDYIGGVSQPLIQTSPNKFSIIGAIKPDSQTSRFITPLSNGIDQFIGYDASTQNIFIVITESNDMNQRLRSAPSGSAPLNTWTYWAISINDKNIMIYINGVLASEFNESINIANWSGDWAIGQRSNSIFWYKGLMGELQVYDRGLTGSEIQQNFNNQKSRYGL